MANLPAKVAFILGPAGAGKTHYVVSKIIESKNRNAGTLRLLLVPDQSTAIYERSLLRQSATGVVTDIAVTGFARLPYVFPLPGWTAPAVAPQSVRRMILFKALIDGNGGAQTQLSATAAGALDQVLEFIDELRRSGFSAADFAEMVEEPERPWLNLKLGEISNAALGLESAMSDAGLTDSLGAQKSLAAHLASLPPDTVPEFELYIDGFSSFSALEMAIVEGLLRLANGACISLLLEPSLLDDPAVPPDSLIYDSVFGHTIETYLQLDKLVNKLKIDRSYIKPAETIQGRGRFSNSPGLLAIERRLADMPLDDDKLPGTVEEAVIVELPSRGAETRFAARKIKALAFAGARYKDIAIIARSLSGYRDVISRTFERFEIPFFIDEPLDISAHPAIRLVSDALSFCVEPSTKDMLSLARNPLCGFAKHGADRIENIILRFGIQPDEIDSDYGLSLISGSGPETKELLENLIKPLCSMKNKIADMQHSSGITDLFLDFLRILRANENMTAFASADIGIPRDAHAGAWDAALGALISISEYCGGTPLTISQYRDFARAALSGATAKITPPALDQVIVSDVERGRQLAPKHVFILGLLEGEFPKQSSGFGILSQDERLYLREKGLKLIGDGITRYVAEKYYFYVACTRASHSLTLTVPAKENADASKSSFLSAISRGGLVKTIHADAPSKPASLEESVTVFEAAAHLKAMGVSSTDDDAISGDGNSAKLAGLLEILPPASFDRLASFVARKRLEKICGVSATRLELLASCRFAHFANYDLRLEERKEWRVDPIDVGTIFHRALELTLIESKRRKIQWRTGDRSSLKSILKEKFENAVNDPEQDWSKNPAIKLVEERLWRNLAGFFDVCLDALAVGEFEPVHSEFSFGGSGDSSQAKIEILSGAGNTYYLRGKIDRLDISQDGNLASIVDYKSSSRSLNWDKLYYGLSIQLALYGYSVRRMFGELKGENEKFEMFGKNEQPILAGAFTHGIDSELSAAPSRRASGDTLAVSKLRGIINADYARAFDKMIAPGMSKYYSFGVKNDGGLRAGLNDLLTGGEWNILFDWFSLKLSSLLDFLDIGDVSVSPVRLGGTSGFHSCAYCPYGAVCRVRTGTDVERLEPRISAEGKGRKDGAIFWMLAELEEAK